MYHRVPMAAPVDYFGVSRAGFAAQLDRLRALGRTATSLEAALAAPGAARTAITFDDGDVTQADCATPELVARAMSATFFVVPARVGTAGYADWAALRRMAEAGMSIQSHTATHPFLSELDPARVQAELRESKARIEDAIGRPVTTIALPGGDFPRRWTAALFEDAGYRWVATSRWGPNAGTLASPLVRRYTVRRETTLARFDSLATAASPALAPEGLRLRALGELRSLLGASRYARWRRRALALLGREGAAVPTSA